MTKAPSPSISLETGPSCVGEWSSASGGGAGGWWQIQFGEAQAVDQITFVSADANRLPTTLLIEHSDDGTTWTTWMPATVMPSLTNNQVYVATPSGIT